MSGEFQASKPIYMQIVDKIKHQLIRGELQAGEKLPSVREMAIQSGVNPNTIQRTYGELESQLIVETKRGQGTFVREDTEMVESLKKERQMEIVRGFVEQMNELGLSTGEIIERVEDFLKKEGPIR